MDLRALLQELADEVKRLVNERIRQYGVNVRAQGKNTLEGSELQKSIESNPIENGIEFQIADYWWYVANGWRRTRRGQKSGLFHALVKWASRKRISIGNYSQSESAYILARKVWHKMIVEERPIPARPFMIPDKDGDITKMIPELNEYIDEWFVNLFNEIMKDIDKFFK